MSETKHTPGPWRFIKSNEEGYSALLGPNNEEVLTPAGTNDGDSPICWLGEDMSEGDRAVIEAAPELLKACEAMLELYCSSKCSESEYQQLVLIRQNLILTVAKANGESNWLTRFLSSP